MKFTLILPDLSFIMSDWMTIRYPETSLLGNVIRTIPSRQLTEEIFERRQGNILC